MELYLVFVLFAHSLQVLLAAPPVEVSPERIILLENRPLEVKCRVRAPISYCRFNINGMDPLSLRPGLPPYLGVQYLGAGFDKGECGILIQSVSSKHSGIITCSMGFETEPIESQGNLTLIVAKPPDPPILKVTPSGTYRDVLREGETIHAQCRIRNARPIANISWFLGNEPIYDRLSPTVAEEENGLMTISQNLTRKVTYVDHGKDLKCVAGHIALGQGSINHSIYKLNVQFPPKPKSQELEKFGFTIGQPGKIVVSFQANPIPTITWKVDQDNLKEGTRDRTGRFEAGVLQKKGAGTWDAILNINTVRAEEVEKRYTLIAQNELGQESYNVAISTSPEPPADITAGAIVGIVIAVLVILLLVFILIFARATGRWCFAGGVPRPPGESLLPYRWPLAKNREKNPRKVNSLIYKDYKLVECEDGSKLYVSPEEKAQILLDGKIKNEKAVEIEHPKTRAVEPETDSDSGYEVPVTPNVTPVKPKSYEGLDRIVDKIPELKRNSSFPFTDMESSPGDNGLINLPPYIVPLETSLTLPMTMKKKKFKKKKQEEPESSSPDEPDGNVEDFPAEFRTREENSDPEKRVSKPRFWMKNRETLSDGAEEKEPQAHFSWKPDAFKKLKLNQKEKPQDKIGELKNSSEDETEPVEKITDVLRRRGLEEPELEEPEEIFTNGVEIPTLETSFTVPDEKSKGRNRKSRYNGRIDTNPLKAMFGIRGDRRSRDMTPGKRLSLKRDERPEESEKEESQPEAGEIASSDVGSDTESADHGSADKSSVSKLTNQKQPKKLMSGLLGSFKKGKKDKVGDNDAARNPPSFEISIKEQSEEPPIESNRTEGIVYAELDMARSPGSVMRREDEKTEYAEIIYPGSKMTSERAMEELRKSRENLSVSRENLTEVDEAFATVTTPDGKKEAAV